MSVGCQRKKPLFVSSDVLIFPHSGVYNHPVSVIMTAQHDMSIFYSINNHSAHQYLTSFTISQQGTYSVKYGATDGLSLPAKWAYATFTIDTTPPLLSLSPSPGTYEVPTEVSVLSSEPASIYVSIEASSFIPYAGAIQVPFSRPFTITAYAVDHAGNKSTAISGIYTVDVPFIRIVSPADGSRLPANMSIPFSAAAYNLRGALPGADITWYTADGRFLGGGITTSAYFSPGVYLIYAAGKNDAGITNKASITLTISSSLFFSLSNPDFIYDVCTDGTYLYGVGSGGLSIFDINGSPVSFLSVNNGLPTNMLFACAHASGGIYIASDKGLIITSSAGISVSDMSNSNILSNNISALYNASDGTLWLGSDPGVMRLANGVFSYQTVPLYLTYAFLSDITDSTIWFGGITGLAHSTATGWITYTTANSGIPSDAVLSLTQNIAGDIAMASFPFSVSSGGVGLFTPSTNTWFTLTTANGLLSNQVFSTIYDQSNRLVISSFSGVSVFTNGTVSQNFSTSVPVLSGVFITNNTWLGTIGSGILKYNGNAVTTVSIPGQFIISNNVQAITFSPDGTVYVGTRGPNNGITEIRNNGITFTQQTPGINTLEYKKGCVWAGTDQGLLSICDNYKIKQYLTNVHVNALLMPWIATNSGLFYSAGSIFSNYTYENTSGGLISNTVNGLARDNNGLLYIGTSKGLSVFDGAQFYKAQAPYKWTGRLTPAKGGGIWITTNLGLCKYKNGASSCYTSPSYIYDIKVDAKGYLWVATRNGFYRYDGYTWLFYPPTLPLPDRIINVINVGPDGKKYIGTDAGLGIYKGN